VPQAKSKITLLLERHSKGEAEALEELLPQVYQHLKRIAVNKMKSESSGHTLQPTALVHEAFLRIASGEPVEWKDRVHFFAVAAQVMRRVLVDHARAKKAEKRGGVLQKTPFDENMHSAKGLDDGEILALDELLQTLSVQSERQAKIVELRYFGGMTSEEIAAALDCSVDTVKRDWRKAKLWLFHAAQEDKKP
jgi:RNA polymerase sigma-70 factor, ECF subfamily